MRLIRRSDQTLRLYVLGELREPSRLDVEERLVTDPDFFEALGMTEDDLTEEYVEGTLSAADTECFERHYLTTHERRQDLAFFRQLKSYAVEQRPTVRLADRLRLNDLFRFHPLWSSVAAGVFILLVGGNLALLLGNYRLQGQFDHVRAEHQREGELRLQLQRQVAALTAQGNTLQGRLESQQGTGSLPTFGLTSGRLRGPGSGARLSISSNAQHVRLELQLPGNDSSPYRAVLYDEAGDVIWSQAKLKAESISGRSAVVVLVPSAVLSSGEYELKLSAATARRDLEVVATYSFRVNLP
jgi:anti-sigma factor RsiW